MNLMSLAPIFSIIIQGNLLKNHLVLQYPINKFQKGIWQIAVDSLSYHFKDYKEQNQYLCALRCNWITSVNFNQNNELITESPFLFQFLISQNKGCIMNNKTWFEINSLSEFLVCEICDLSNNSILSVDCSVFVFFQIQRKI